MIIVNEDLDRVLDSLWYRLETAELKRHENGISQVDLDEICVKRLQDFVNAFEKCEHDDYLAMDLTGG